MEFIESVSEDYMVASFLKGEANSARFAPIHAAALQQVGAPFDRAFTGPRELTIECLRLNCSAGLAATAIDTYSPAFRSRLNGSVSPCQSEKSVISSMPTIRRGSS